MTRIRGQRISDETAEILEILKSAFKTEFGKKITEDDMMVCFISGYIEHINKGDIYKPISEAKRNDLYARIKNYYAPRIDKRFYKKSIQYAFEKKAISLG